MNCGVCEQTLTTLVAGIVALGNFTFILLRDLFFGGQKHDEYSQDNHQNGRGKGNLA